MASLSAMPKPGTRPPGPDPVDTQPPRSAGEGWHSAADIGVRAGRYVGVEAVEEVAAEDRVQVHNGHADGDPEPGSSSEPTGPSIPPRMLLALLAGVLVVMAALGLLSTPADGPLLTGGTLADEVLMPEPALRIDESTPTPTSLSSTAVESPPTTLNPNALFVSAESGDDGADGTGFESALASLQTALDRVEPGETIYVMDGVYRELVEPRNAHYVARRGGTADAPVRIEAAPDHRPVIIASNGNGLEIQADYVEVVGLTVRGEGYDTENNPWGNGILIRNSHHVRVAGNEISGMPLNGISTVESSNLIIVGNEIYENAFWNHSQGSGISLWHSVSNGEPPDPDGYHDRVIGNRVYRNENKVTSVWFDYEVITDGNGIIIDQGRETNYDGRVLVANNVVFDNGGRGIMVFETDRVDVIHNTVYRNGRTAELFGGPTELSAAKAKDVRFGNNLVWPREDSNGIRVSDAQEVSSIGNLVVDTGSPGQTSAEDVVIAGDPLLVNPSIDETVADFRPTGPSPAVGMAVDFRPRINWDRNGVDRRLSDPTVGAYAESPD